MKSGFAAVAGRPNVGKSTLVNALTGEKVAIVSKVPHTTRHRIRGVWTATDAQLVLVDLPGWQKPIDTLTERMQEPRRRDDRRRSRRVLLVVNARERIGAGDRYVARRVFALGIPVVIVAQQGRPAEGRAHRDADEGRRRARRLPRAASREREDGRRDRCAPLRSRLAAARRGRCCTRPSR